MPGPATAAVFPANSASAALTAAPTAAPAASARSELVRLLAPQLQADRAAAEAPLAQRLGDWMGWTHAITLSAALAPAPAAGVPTLPRALRRAQAERCTADREALVRSLHAAWADPGDRAELDEGEPGDDTPWRRRHARAQRHLEPAVATLRARVRQAVGGASARLQQLAALDAALEAALASSLRELLGRVPGLLAARCAAFDRSDAAAWRARCLAEQQALLQAELALRLQPVDGLIEALREET